MYGERPYSEMLYGASFAAALALTSAVTAGALAQSVQSARVTSLVARADQTTATSVQARRELAALTQLTQATAGSTLAGVAAARGNYTTQATTGAAQSGIATGGVVGSFAASTATTTSGAAQAKGASTATGLAVSSQTAVTGPYGVVVDMTSAGQLASIGAALASAHAAVGDTAAAAYMTSVLAGAPVTRLDATVAGAAIQITAAAVGYTEIATASAGISAGATLLSTLVTRLDGASISIAQAAAAQARVADVYAVAAAAQQAPFLGSGSFVLGQARAFASQEAGRLLPVLTVALTIADDGSVSTSVRGPDFIARITPVTLIARIT
jgi:hypothetical protein